MKKLFDKNNNGVCECFSEEKIYPLIEMHWKLWDKREGHSIGKYGIFYSFNTTAEELQELRNMIMERRNYE